MSEKNMNNEECRVIKKYPNRRLYDTTVSSYITLMDVKRLVIEKVSLKIIDARSKVDITHNTLLQIIMEQEEQGPPLFTTDLLQQMIRNYGKMFEQGMEFFSANPFFSHFIPKNQESMPEHKDIEPSLDG